MRFAKLTALTSALVFLTATSMTYAMPRVHRGPTAPRLFRSRAATPKAQPKKMAHIEPERATQIQTALIASGYMAGSPSGTWDPQTQAAMEKLQADNGWQTKLVPDARAIIKLGLGPSNAPTEDLATTGEAREAVTPQSEPPAASPANQ